MTGSTLGIAGQWRWFFFAGELLTVLLAALLAVLYWPMPASQGIAAKPVVANPADETAQLKLALSTQEARLTKLTAETLSLQKLVAEQRHLLRPEALQPTDRPVEDFLSMFPARFPQGNWQPAEWLFEDRWFSSADGLRLHGWYRKHPQPKGALLFMHGNGANLAYRAQWAEYLHKRLGVSVLIFDYRGFGRSEGVPTLDGILRDARAARHDLAQLEGIAEDLVILFGESLGGAVAIDLAQDGARGLIVECTFTSLKEVAKVHVPRVVVETGMTSDKLVSIDKIGHYHGPLLLCHAELDTIVPCEHGRKLFSAANEPKTFFLLPGADHGDMRSEAYFQVMEAFLTRL